MEAPEKIYLVSFLENPKDRTWYWQKQFGCYNTEYTRTDAFIDKADKWLSLNMKMLMNVLDVEYDTHDTDIKDFIADFKKYMEEQQ